jgi:hypothetical protein
MANSLMEEWGAILRLEAEREALDRGIQARVLAFRDRARAGESTGDPIRDHVLRKFNEINEEMEQPYRDLTNKVAAHAGQFILVVNQTPDRSMQSMDSYDMGILTDEPKFLMYENVCAFTTTRRIAWGCYFRHKVLETYLPIQDPAYNQTWSEIHFGDEKVKEWFKKERPLPFGNEPTEKRLLQDFWDLAERLGRPQIENPQLQTNPS